MKNDIKMTESLFLPKPGTYYQYTEFGNTFDTTANLLWLKAMNN